MLVLKQITVITFFFRTIYVLKSCFLFRPILWWILNHHASRPLPNPWGHDINNKIKRPVREILALHSNKVESPSLIDACSRCQVRLIQGKKKDVHAPKKSFSICFKKKKIVARNNRVVSPHPYLMLRAWGCIDRQCSPPSLQYSENIVVMFGRPPQP